MTDAEVGKLWQSFHRSHQEPPYHNHVTGPGVCPACDLVPWKYGVRELIQKLVNERAIYYDGDIREALHDFNISLDEYNRYES